MIRSRVLSALTCLAMACCCGCVSGQSDGSVNSAHALPLGVELNRDTIYLDNFTQATLLVTLVNRYNCKTCFNKIESYVLDSLQADSTQVGLIALARFGGKSLDRRAAMQFVENTMPRFTRVIFDAQSGRRDGHPPREVQGGWHGRLDVRYTPEVVIFNKTTKGAPLHFRYNDLFVTGENAGDSLGHLSWRGKQLLREALGF